MIAATVAALAAAAGGPSEPVAVTSSEVALVHHDGAVVRVACRRARPCHGLLVLGTGCDLHPTPLRCQVPVGIGRFWIRGGREASVQVMRIAGTEMTGAGRDRVVVTATPYLRARSRHMLTRRTRRLTLVTPPGLRLPAVPTRTEAQRVRHSLDARGGPQLRVWSDLPLGTTRAQADVAGRAVPLHAYGWAPYLVPADSFAVAAVRFHGETPVEDGAFAVGERHRYRLDHCAGETCGAEEGELEIRPDPRDTPGPICRLHPLPAAT